jgi:hypothetical protein
VSVCVTPISGHVSTNVRNVNKQLHLPRGAIPVVSTVVRVLALAAQQVPSSLILMRVKNWDYRELSERIAATSTSASAPLTLPRPIPLAPPVTIATRPANLSISRFLVLIHASSLPRQKLLGNGECFVSAPSLLAPRCVPFLLRMHAGLKVTPEFACFLQFYGGIGPERESSPNVASPDAGPFNAT